MLTPAGVLAPGGRPDSTSAIPSTTRCAARCGRRSWSRSRRPSASRSRAIRRRRCSRSSARSLAGAGRLPRQPADPRAGLRRPRHSTARSSSRWARWCRRIPWLAVTLMFLLGVAVMFSGVLSEIDRGGAAADAADVRAARVHAAGTDRRAAARVGDRAGGVRARRAVPAAAAPPRRAAQARGQRVCRRWPTDSRATPAARRGRRRCWRCGRTSSAPTSGPSGCPRAVARWCGWSTTWNGSPTGSATRRGAGLRRHAATPGVRVLRCSAAVLTRKAAGRRRTTDRADLEAALTDLRSVAHSRYRRRRRTRSSAHPTTPRRSRSAERC